MVGAGAIGDIRRGVTKTETDVGEAMVMQRKQHHPRSMVPLDMEVIIGQCHMAQ